MVGFVVYFILIGMFYYCMREVKEVLVSFGKYMYFIVFYWFMIIVFIIIMRIGEVLFVDGSVISVLVLLLWMVYVLFVVWFGRNRNMDEILYVGLVVLVVMVGKLFLFDLLEVLMMIRVVLFLIVGSIGIVILRMFFLKEEKWEEGNLCMDCFFYYFLLIVIVLLYFVVVFWCRWSVVCLVVFELICIFIIFLVEFKLFVVKENVLLYLKVDG